MYIYEVMSGLNWNRWRSLDDELNYSSNQQHQEFRKHLIRAYGEANQVIGQHLGSMKTIEIRSCRFHRLPLPEGGIEQIAFVFETDTTNKAFVVCKLELPWYEDEKYEFVEKPLRIPRVKKSQVSH
jgi:hypothetical protein